MVHIGPLEQSLNLRAKWLGAAQVHVVREASGCQILKSVRDSPFLRGVKSMMEFEPLLAFLHLVRTLDNVPFQCGEVFLKS